MKCEFYKFGPVGPECGPACSPGRVFKVRSDRAASRVFLPGMLSLSAHTGTDAEQEIFIKKCGRETCGRDS